MKAGRFGRRWWLLSMSSEAPAAARDLRHVFESKGASAEPKAAPLASVAPKRPLVGAFGSGSERVSRTCQSVGVNGKATASGRPWQSKPSWPKTAGRRRLTEGYGRFPRHDSGLTICSASGQGRWTQEALETGPDLTLPQILFHARCRALPFRRKGILSRALSIPQILWSPQRSSLLRHSVEPGLGRGIGP